MIVKTYLPYIRRSLAQKLVENKGVSQCEAAEKLGLTQAAVSQYLSRKRASEDIEEVGLLERLTDDFAEALAEREMSDEERVVGLCTICVELRSSESICDPHLSNTELADCNICCA